MAVEIRVPALGESVTEATVGQWFKRPGEAVQADEPVCELETEKVTVEVPAPASGVLGDIQVQQGETVAVGTLLGTIKEGAAPEKPAAAAPAKAEAAAAPAAKPAKAPAKAEGEVMEKAVAEAGGMPPSPAARKIMEEKGLTPEQITGTGRRGQILKEDVLEAAPAAPAAAPQPPAETVPFPVARTAPAPAPQMRAPSAPSDAAREERVRMTRLRQTIARRLKDAQDTAAMLTTFNDVDMSAVMSLRAQYRDLFEKRHGIRLGFMGFFVKACIQALREIPAVNAEIDGTDIIYKNYYHIGVAVSTDKGLVVPV